MQASRKRPCVLVVEDEPDALEMLTEYLGSEGFEVVQARDGIDALSFVYATPPALVLVDMMMPRMTGLELIAQLRQDGPAVAGIPIVAMSAATGLLSRALEAGADAALPKPLDLGAIVRIIEQHCS